MISLASYPKSSSIQQISLHHSTCRLRTRHILNGAGVLGWNRRVVLKSNIQHLICHNGPADLCLKPSFLFFSHKILNKLLNISVSILFYFILFFGHATWLVGSSFPDQGLNPGLQQWKLGVLTTGLPGNSQSQFFKLWSGNNNSNPFDSKESSEKTVYKIIRTIPGKE